MLAKKSDDLNHEPRPDAVWRESYFFAFYDPGKELWMYTSMGERPFKNHAGSILTIWNKQGAFANNFIFDSVNRTDRVHRTQGLAYECLEPLEKWRLTYKGTLAKYPEPALRINPADMTLEAARKRPQEKIEFDLIWEAIDPCYSYDPVPGMFDMHLEQHGRIRGGIKIGNEKIDVDGTSIRDRSYGTRDWLSVKGWTWTPMFIRNPNLPLVASAETRFLDGKADGVGFIYDRGKKNIEDIVKFKEDVKRKEAEHLGIPIRCTFRLEGNQGTSLTYEGEVVKVIPTVLMFKGAPGTQKEGTCWIDRCLVKYEITKNQFEFGEVEIGNMLDYRLTL